MKATFAIALVVFAIVAFLIFQQRRVPPPNASMTTQELIDSAKKCGDHKESQETCGRLDSILKARLQRCDDRLTLTGSKPNTGGAFSPMDWLEYCDERFPDLRR